MSDVMERTLASIPRLLSSALLGGRGGQPPDRRCQPSQSFQTFLRNVDSAYGRSQQAAVVQRELSRIKQQFEQPDCTVAQWCEHFPLLIYCSILGHDVSFCHIYALKLAASGKGLQKRVGYLAATLLLHPSSDVTILITGTVLKDLSSSNVLDNLMALVAAAELTSPENFPYMLPPVMKLLRHRQAMVRARAVSCLHAFLLQAFDVMHCHLGEVKSMLADHDPGVLRAVVTIVELLLQRKEKEFAGVGLALVSILQQVRAYKFPAHFCYHGLPLPWLQVKLLRALSLLPPNMDDPLTSSLPPLLSSILRDTVGKEMMSLAILEECLMTVVALAKASLPKNRNLKEKSLTTSTSHAAMSENCDQSKLGSTTAEVAMSQHHNQAEQHPGLAKDVSENQNQAEQQIEEKKDSGEIVRPSLGSGEIGEQSRPGGETEAEEEGERTALKTGIWMPVLEEASRCVGSFLGADRPNLRYIGVKVLAQLVTLSADLALPHKDKVVTCLNDPDPIVRRQTLTLLHGMAVRDNFKAVCATMLRHVRREDAGVRGGGTGRDSEIVDMVIDICHRLNSDPEWYLTTIFPLLSWQQLDGARISAIMEDMLAFFVRATKEQDRDGDPRWPDFPQLLLRTMVENIISMSSEGKGNPSVKFSLRVLRSVALPPTCDSSFPKEKFLSACRDLLGCEHHRDEMKEEVVLCVRELMLRGLLDQQGVSAWNQDCLTHSDLSLPSHHHLLLTELLRLATLQTAQVASLTEHLSSTLQEEEEMDFSLSFLDLSCRQIAHQRVPFLKRMSSERGGDNIGGTAVTIPSPGQGSERSVRSEEGAASYDSSPLYASFTEPGRENVEGKMSREGGSEPLTDKNITALVIPGVKRRWTEHGFDNTPEEKSTPPPPPSPQGSNTGDKAAEEGEGRQDKGEEEELADALFQGLSPMSSVNPLLPPTSHTITTTSVTHKSNTSSGFDSFTSSSTSGWQDVTSIDNRSSVNPPLSSTFTTTTTTSEEGGAYQYDVVHSRPELSFDMVSNDSELLFSSSSSPPPPPAPATSWKVILDADSHNDDDDDEDTEGHSPHTDPLAAVQTHAYTEATLTSSSVGSNLSISDDSLENTGGGAGSVPGSPFKQAAMKVRNPSLPSPEEGLPDSVAADTDNSAMSLFLEAQMMQQEHESEESVVVVTDTEGSSPDGEGERAGLYSGFELLTPCSQGQSQGQDREEEQSQGEEVL